MLLPAISFEAITRTVRRFGGSRRGSAAVEFALVAPMFFALIFAIIETSLVFFAGQVLETANQDTARLLLISSAPSQAAYKQALCDRVSVILACANVYVDVRLYPAGTAITITDPIDASGNFTNNFVYSTPVAGATDTIVARSFYQWPLLVTQLGYNIANIGRGTTSSYRLLASTAAVRQQ
ncbi:pilus assembly protein [soil metagenome]